MKAPLKDSLRVSETIFPPAPVPRVRTVTAVAEGSTPTLMPLITMAELGPSIRIKSFAPAVTSRVTVTAPSAPLTSNDHALDEQIYLSGVSRINRDGPIAVVIVVLRHPRHYGISCRAVTVTVGVSVSAWVVTVISAARGTEKCSMIVVILDSIRGRRIEEDAAGRLIFTPLRCEVLRVGEQLDLGEVRISILRLGRAHRSQHRTSRAIVNSVLMFLISIKLLCIVLICLKE